MANSIPFLLFYCCWLSFSHLLSSSSVHGGQGATWHEVPLRSLLPAKLCSSSSSFKASDRSKMEVVHRHGPCWSPSGVPKPSHHQLLTEDQARVDWIHRRAPTPAKASTSAVSIPAYPGVSVGVLNYIVSVGLGTPAKQLSLIFDTGSDVTWVQCKPCVSCYQQRDPFYDPTQSSTYGNLSCTSDDCFLLDSPECSPQSTCRYTVNYGDNSQTKGFFVQDTLTLTATDSLADFLFGCGDQNTGLFGQSAGLIGLGREAVSLVSQATPKYGAGFAYCLPSTSSSTGYLKLGSGGVPANVQFTPMLSYSNLPTFYFLNLIGISVGGQKLPIPSTIFSNAGIILDSGTVITRLPPSAYSVLRSAFRQQMVNYPTAPALTILDTCYNFTGYNTIKVPVVALQFDKRAPLNIDVSGILYVASVSQVCLAFAANGNDGDLGIIGNMLQRKLNVVYDLSNKMIGFGAGGCN